MNVTIPLDVTRKRRPAGRSRSRRLLGIEAQFQDAIRLQIDNLYTIFVGCGRGPGDPAVQPGLPPGDRALVAFEHPLLKPGQIKPADVDALRAQAKQAQLQVREAQEALVTTTLELAVLLNVPRGQAEALRIQGSLRDVREVPMPPGVLIERRPRGVPT